MKRFHVHVAVEDLATSTRFYSALFGSQPSVAKTDYAKWLLEDPRINFAISQRGSKRGVNHLGFQVDTGDELTALQSQHNAADLPVFNEGATQCCYAQSTKHWLTDPQGVAWEIYHTMGEVQTYNGASEDANASKSACCAPGKELSSDRSQRQDALKTASAPAGGCSTACCPEPAPA